MTTQRNAACLLNEDNVPAPLCRLPNLTISTCKQDCTDIFITKMKSSCAAVALLCAVPLPRCWAAADAGALKFCVTLAEQPFAGASIGCFDKDLFGNNYIVNGTTDRIGCATLTYQTKTTKFLELLEWVGCLLLWD
jgi:hypothetical protein